MAVSSILKDVQADGDDYVLVCVEVVGTGASNPTASTGQGVTVTRTGAGAYRATFDDEYASMVCGVASLKAATPGDLSGHTVILDTYDATNKRIDLVVYNATPTAHDLAANEYLALMFVMRKTGY